MNKSELIDTITADTGFSRKDVERFLGSFIATVTNVLVKRDELRLIGFGTFTTVERTARVAKPPITKKEVLIEATVAPKFKPGQALKDAVAKNNKVGEKK